MVKETVQLNNYIIFPRRLSGYTGINWKPDADAHRAIEKQNDYNTDEKLHGLK